jgi:enoyl reductase-like protein
VSNRNKHQIGDFMQEDFAANLQKVEARLSQGDWTQKLKKNHTRYFSMLEQKSQIINNMLDAYKPDIFNNILIDIVMFNETCTTR